MDNVQWIKLKVGMFDGESFKKIKKAKIGGESFRDKLTAVWFELLDFAGKCNHSGFLINSREIPFQSISDIAVMIDRTPEELELCMQFFINEGMVEIIDDIYLLSNWMMYQNEAGLEKIREQTRRRVAKHRAQKALNDVVMDDDSCNVTCNVTNALQNRYPLILTSKSSIPSNKKDRKGGVGEKEEKKQPVSDEINSAIAELPSNVQEQMEGWLDYKTERKEIYAQRGLKSLLSVVKKNVDRYGEQTVCDVIERSMASNYQGIVWSWCEEKKTNQQTMRPIKNQVQTDYGSPEDFYK